MDYNTLSLSDVMQPLESFRQGEAVGLQDAQRNLLREVGGQAATGNYLKAAQTAMQGGDLNTGMEMQKHHQSIQDRAGSMANASIERRLKIADFFKDAANRADTPEKWNSVVDLGSSIFGADDAERWRPYDMRMPALDEINKSKIELQRLRLQELQIANQQRELTKPEFKEVNGRIIRLPGGADDPAVDITPDGMPIGNEKPPAGYRWSPNGRDLEVISGGPATKIPGEMAGKVALMQGAIPRIEKVRSVLEEDWGVGGALQSWFTGTPLIGDVPAISGKIGEAAREVRIGIEAALRVMTGAAAPDSEVDRYMQMYMPNSKDTKDSAKQKIDNLLSFMRDSEALTVQGRGAAPLSPQVSEFPIGGMTTPSARPVMPPRAVVPGGQGQIPPNAVRFLMQNLRDPAVIQQFEQKYGPGSAQQFLQGR